MYYKINLYKIDNDRSSNYIHYIDQIIVKKGLFSSKEIITNEEVGRFSKNLIESLNKLESAKTIIDDYCRVYTAGLLTFNEDYKKENIIKKEDLDSYLEKFSTSDFKKYYDKTKKTVVTKNHIEKKLRGKHE